MSSPEVKPSSLSVEVLSTSGVFASAPLDADRTAIVKSRQSISTMMMVNKMPSRRLSEATTTPISSSASPEMPGTPKPGVNSSMVTRMNPASRQIAAGQFSEVISNNSMPTPPLLGSCMQYSTARTALSVFLSQSCARRVQLSDRTLHPQHFLEGIQIVQIDLAQ